MKHNHRKMLLIGGIALAAVMIMAGVLLGWHLLAGQEPSLEGAQIAEYNAAITAVARKGNKIGSNDFILIDQLSKGKDGHTDVTIRVYRLPEGADQADYMHLQVGDLPESFGPEYMGHGTARLLNGSLSSIVLNVTYIR